MSVGRWAFDVFPLLRVPNVTSFEAAYTNCSHSGAAATSLTPAASRRNSQRARLAHWCAAGAPRAGPLQRAVAAAHERSADSRRCSQPSDCTAGAVVEDNAPRAGDYRLAGIRWLSIARDAPRFDERLKAEGCGRFRFSLAHGAIRRSRARHRRKLL